MTEMQGLEYLNILGVPSRVGTACRSQ